ncbi:hypothetical protein ACFFGV_00390 [Pontibacillus salicampi]|uniref:Uncharacterized protein n=1 Tax=Pontibacillus salicampi TaxID=1449801 RepID=A0ABV6LI70_9BACI
MGKCGCNRCKGKSVCLENNKVEERWPTDPEESMFFLTAIAPKFLCPGQTFRLQVPTCFSLAGCTGPATASVSIGFVEINLNGPATFQDFGGCGSGCPEGSFFGVISPDGKETLIALGDYALDCLVSVKPCPTLCCCLELVILVEEGASNQPITVDGTFFGDVNTSDGCPIGEFSGGIEVPFTITSTLTSDTHPCCRCKETSGCDCLHSD